MIGDMQGGHGSTPIAAFRDVHVRFGGVVALRAVDIAIEQGRFVGLIGPNGAGKTSLLNVLSGVYRATEGTVELLGVDVTRLRTDRFATRGVARTFQNLALFANETVLNNVLVGAGVSTGGRRFWRARDAERRARLRAEEVIELLELEHVRSLRVADLPYGIAKRVDLARAVAMAPRLLLLDEPVAGMNEEEVGDMARYIIDIRSEFQPAIVLVEHHLGFVMDLTDTVIVLDFGEVIFEGSPSEAQEDTRVISAYIGEDTNDVLC